MDRRMSQERFLKYVLLLRALAHPWLQQATLAFGSTRRIANLKGPTAATTTAYLYINMGYKENEG
jgi:hypothetical protein